MSECVCVCGGGGGVRACVCAYLRLGACVFSSSLRMSDSGLFLSISFQILFQPIGNVRAVSASLRAGIDPEHESSGQSHSFIVTKRSGVHVFPP